MNQRKNYLLLFSLDLTSQKMDTTEKLSSVI